MSTFDGVLFLGFIETCYVIGYDNDIDTILKLHMPFDPDRKEAQ